jgi:hypothetical protein
MAVKLVWNKKKLNFERLEWSGTHNQSSRQVTFTIPSNPYDKDFKNTEIKLGDLVLMYDGTDRLFAGTVTKRERSAEVGTVTYTAMDFMHHLLRSNGTYKFKNTSPEKITAQLCRELSIGTSEIAKTGVNIQKLFFDDQCIYDIIVKAYRKAHAKNGKKYMPVMDGKKVSVIEKGRDSGVTLDQGTDITAASYTDTTDNMVNLVKIYNDSAKQIGKVCNADHMKKYGVYQSVYKKEKGVNAKTEAEAMLAGITKEASVEAVGYIKAVSGYSIKIHDKATGLSGKFYITSDTHIFENSVHTMKLDLSWKNEMEEGAQTESGASKTVKKKKTADAACYYLETGSVYHSVASCYALSGKTPKKTTVSEIEKILISKGTNKGSQKYKACDKCWR